jgi:hypothetical protein
MPTEILLKKGALFMRKRKRLSRQKSRRDFRKKSGIHPRNNPHGSVMRGGIRM